MAILYKNVFFLPHIDGNFSLDICLRVTVEIAPFSNYFQQKASEARQRAGEEIASNED